MIKLSKRLQLVASFVPDNSYLIDVGCDHAFLDIYLYNNLKNIKILATDINENPLKIAEENINKYGLKGKIKLKQQDGIKNLDKEIDTIVIAGMGGILISDILSQKEYLENIKTIIVSPNNDFELVRKTLSKIGFMIQKEALITENKITYLVIRAKRGKKKRINYFFGTLKANNLEVIYYYTKLLQTNTKILKKLPKKYIFKKWKLKYQNRRIKNFLKKID